MITDDDHPRAISKSPGSHQADKGAGLLGGQGYDKAAVFVVGRGDRGELL